MEDNLCIDVAIWSVDPTKGLLLLLLLKARPVFENEFLLLVEAAFVFVSQKSY
jgi:hypothetical protein